MRFKGNTITFNGISSLRYGLYLCSVDGGSDYFSREFGTERSINKENGTITSIEQAITTVTLQLVKLDNKSNPSPISKDELTRISHWLFSPEEYKPLIVDQNSVVYYGIFVRGQVWQNECDQGYLTLDFELNSNHAYTIVQNSYFRVNGTRDITLNSQHTYGLYNEIDIEIELASGQTGFTIINRTTGQTMTLSGLSNCTHVYIYNDGVKHIENVDNKSQNLRGNFNKVFIHLTYGTNQLRLQGVGTVRFISQGKLLLT